MKKALYICLECGKKFYSANTAGRALFYGCSKCGGVDIDIASCPASGSAQADYRTYVKKESSYVIR
jgi:hypothetical protein